MMRSATAVPGLLVLLAAIAAVADECHIICADVKRTINAKSACSAFRNSLPRPKVARYCQDAFKEAVDTNCYDACINDGKLSSFHAESQLDQKCNRALNDTPRPLCHDACVKGFRSGIEDMSASLLKRIAKSSPAVLASLREDLKSYEYIYTERAHAAAADAAPYGADTGELGVEITAGRAIDAVVEQPTSESDTKTTDGKLDAEYERGAPLNHQEQYQGETKEAWENPPAPADFHDKAEGSIEKAKGNHLRTIPEEDGVVLSLPISVDDVEMELTIFENDEPADVIFAFCKENMPDAGTACVDQLVLVVQDKLAEAGNPEMITA